MFIASQPLDIRELRRSGMLNLNDALRAFTKPTFHSYGVFEISGGAFL